MRHVFGKRGMAVALIIALLLSIIPLPQGGEAQAATIKLSKSSVKVMVKGTTTIKLVGATAKKVKWASKNQKIATVSGGKIKGVKKGSTKVTAKYNGKTYTAKVTVSAVPFFENATMELVVGGTGKAVLTGAKANKITWSTKNKKIATVNKGNVKGVKAGTTKINAVYNKKTYTLTVKVVAVPKMKTTSLNLTVGKSASLKLTSIASSKATWKSSNKGVATVSAAGVVKGIKAGAATITATYQKKSCKCAVNVMPPSVGTISKPSDAIDEWGSGGGPEAAKVPIDEWFYDNIVSYDAGNITTDGGMATNVNTLGSNTESAGTIAGSYKINREGILSEDAETVLDATIDGLSVSVPKDVSIKGGNGEAISGSIRVTMEKASGSDVVELKAYKVSGDPGDGSGTDVLGSANEANSATEAAEDAEVLTEVVDGTAADVILDEGALNGEEAAPAETEPAEAPADENAGITQEGEPEPAELAPAVESESDGTTESDVQVQVPEATDLSSPVFQKEAIAAEAMNLSSPVFKMETVAEEFVVEEAADTESAQEDDSEDAVLETEEAASDEQAVEEEAAEPEESGEAEEAEEFMETEETEELVEAEEVEESVETEGIEGTEEVEETEEAVEAEENVDVLADGELIEHPILSEPVTVSFQLDKFQYDDKCLDQYRGVYLYEDESGNTTEVYLMPDRQRLKEDQVLEFTVDHFSKVSVAKLTGVDAYRHAAHIKAVNQLNQKGLYDSVASKDKKEMEDVVAKILKDTGVADDLVSLICSRLGSCGELLEMITLAKDGTSNLEDDKVHQKVCQIVAKKTLDVIMKKAGEKVPGLDVLTNTAQCGVKVYDQCLNGDYTGAYESIMKACADNLPVVKYGKFCEAVCEAGANAWTDANMEEMYKAYCGEEIKWRPGADACKQDLNMLKTVYAGAFNAYYIQRYKEHCAATGLSFSALMNDKETRENLKTQYDARLEKEFAERYAKDSKIKAAENEIVDFLVACEKYGLLERNRYGFGIEGSVNADATDYDRVERLLQVKDEIDKIFKAEGMTAEQAFMSSLYTNPKANTNARYADLIKQWVNTDNAVHGRRAVLEYIQHNYGKYRLNQTEVSTKLYKRGRLKLYNAAGKDITAQAKWTSTNTSVATVDKGVVATLWPGETTSVAAYAGREFSCTVKVNDPVSIAPTSKSLKVGEAFTVEVKGLQTPDPKPEYACDTYPAKIVTVDANGVVKGVSAGSMAVRVYLNKNGGQLQRAFTCQVTVTDPNAGKDSGGGSSDKFNPVGRFTGTYWRKSTGTTVSATALVEKSTPAAAGYTDFKDDGTWYTLYVVNEAGVGTQYAVIRVGSDGAITYGNINGTFSNNGNKLVITNALGSYKYVLTK